MCCDEHLPYGDSTVLFIATGVVPFLTFSYLARFMMLSVLRARQLLAFPEVKVIDMLFASALLEVLAASCVTIVLIIIAWFAGIDAVPMNIVQAALAFGAAILLGLGFGLLNGVIALAIPGWFTGYSLINILLWATAGIFFCARRVAKYSARISRLPPSAASCRVDAVGLLRWIWQFGTGSALRNWFWLRNNISWARARTGDARTFACL